MSKKIYPLKIGVCGQCGGDIIATYSALNKPTRKYCGHRCATIIKNKKMVWTDEMRAKLAAVAKKTFTGRKQSEKHIRNKAKAISGKNHWNWQGGKTHKNIKIRNSFKYKQWRKAVYERDNYTCQECGVRSKRGAPVLLNADHIKSFAHYPKYRFDVANGITLCLNCHRKTKNFGANNLFVKILQIDKNGNLIKEWPSLRHAALKTNNSKTAIQNCLSKRSKSSGGYIWKYK